MILYPVNYEIPLPPAQSTEGRNVDLAKAIIRYAVGATDDPLDDKALIRLVSGHLTKQTLAILKPLRGNLSALQDKITELGIPIVSTSLTEPERLDAIDRAKNANDIIGSPQCKSLSRGEVIQCINDVIAERQSGWTYEE